MVYKRHESIFLQFFCIVVKQLIITHSVRNSWQLNRNGAVRLICLTSISLGSLQQVVVIIWAIRDHLLLLNWSLMIYIKTRREKCPKIYITYVMWVACKIYPLYLCKCLYMTGNSIEKKSNITAAALRLQHIKCFVCCEKKLCIKRVCKETFLETRFIISWQWYLTKTN